MRKAKSRRSARCSERSTRRGLSGERACRPRCCGTLSAPRRLAPGSTNWLRTISGARALVSATSRAANISSSGIFITDDSQTFLMSSGCRSDDRAASNKRFRVSSRSASSETPKELPTRPVRLRNRLAATHHQCAANFLDPGQNK